MKDRYFFIPRYILANDMWRYSINDGEIGGVVFAKFKDEAEKKIREKYKRDDFIV